MYRYILYTQERNIIIPPGIKKIQEQNKHLIKTINSPIKLIVGGAAMFVMQVKNHHKVKEGLKESNPLVRIILRVDK